jgi:hypothetical protein
MTLEMLITWHQQRAAECLAIQARATIMPKNETVALTAMAQFHLEAVRLLQTFEGPEDF